MAQNDGLPKCTCCQWRYATYKARYKANGIVVDKFCRLCRVHNPVSENGAYDLKYDKETLKHPRNKTPPEERVRGYECWCCERYYKKKAVVKYQYTCREHSFLFCLRCANKHEYCPEDKMPVSQESRDKLDLKLAGVELEDMDPITPI